MIAIGTILRSKPVDDVRPRSRQSAARLGGTILIAALANASLAAARLLLPIIALGLGATTFFVGIMSALFAASPMMFSVGFGRWVDRIGPRRPMILATTLIAAAGIPFLAFPRIEMLMPMAALVGTGAIFAHVAALRAVSASFSASDRTRNLGFLVFSYSLFQFLGPLVASITFEHLGTPAGLRAICGIALLALVGTLAPWQYYAGHSVAAPPAQRRGIGSLVAIRPLRMWLIISSVFSTAQVIFPFVISLHSVAVGLSAPQAGIALGAFALGTAASRLGVGFVSRHCAPKAIASASLLAGAIAYALIPPVDDLHLLLPLCAALGLSLGMGVPIALIPIYDEAPEGRVNEAVGLSMTLNTFLQTATPLVCGAVAMAWGVGAMIWILATTLLAATILATTMLRDRVPT